MLETSIRANKVLRWRTGFMGTRKSTDLNRDALKAEDGVKYFRDKLRPHFVKGAYSVSFWRFYLLMRAGRGHTEMVDKSGKFDLLLKRAKDAWMDMLPLSSMMDKQRQAQYQADILKTILVLFFKIKVQTRSSSQTKEHQSRRGKESSYSQSGFSASETRSEEGYGHSWETISILQVQLQEELLHGMARDILRGWRQFL